MNAVKEQMNAEFNFSTDEADYGNVYDGAELCNGEAIQEWDNYFDWAVYYPELQYLIDNIAVIKEEALRIHQWTPWPENHYKSAPNNNNDWTVFPFLHTFPATDPSKSKWIRSTSSFCPKTVSLLKTIPRIRTALFSKLGANTRVSFLTICDTFFIYFLFVFAIQK